MPSMHMKRSLAQTERGCSVTPQKIRPSPRCRNVWKLDGVDTVYYRVVDGTTNQIGTPYSVLKDDQVTVKGSVTKEQMNALDAEGAVKPTLTITAYASQLHKNATDTFSASEAWNNIANK